MICINGEVIKSADELCDSCAVELCPTMEQFLKIHQHEYSYTRKWRFMKIVKSYLENCRERGAKEHCKRLPNRPRNKRDTEIMSRLEMI